MNQYLNEYNQHIYITLGNHEDYQQIKSLEYHPEYYGWLFNPTYPRILVAPRGHRWNWDGVSFVSIGGANSIDRRTRTENINWWTEEQISNKDIEDTIIGGYADIMVAHDCPDGVPLFGGHKAGKDNLWPPTSLVYAKKSRQMLRKATDIIKPNLFLHGHYHFTAKYSTTLNDGKNDYTLNSLGFSSDNMKENIALLSLPELELEYIKYHL